MRTMKIMKRMMSLAAAILALSACSESDDILSSFHNDPNAVHITAEVGKASADGFTRSNPLGTTEEDQQKFNEKDEISVKADGQEAVTYKFNGTEWIPQDSKFLKWESENMNFTAYYPASYNGGTITQPTEYTSEKSLADADFMSYTGSQSNTNGNTLTLTMQRQMARVVVDVAKFNDQYAGATIDNINSLSICGVKAYKHNDNKFYALIDPNYTPSTTAPFLTLEVAEGESKTTETLTTTPATFEAGKSYTYQLTVGKNKVVVTGITVADWTEGTTISDKTVSYPYVTFKADGEQTFMMTTLSGYKISGLEYSVNDGAWKTLVADEEIPFGGDNGTLRLRGTNNSKGTASTTTIRSTIEFGNNTEVACEGDIRTLIDYKNYKTVETNNARFCYLFAGCEVLTSAPDLPATKLADYCYCGMFNGCSKLQEAPKLPATNLAAYCYSSMFVGCTSLTKAPELPATTLANSCYKNMFNVCTNLSTVTMLASSDQITDKENCCLGWLTDAGTDPSVTSRKLILKDVDAYDALVSKDYLPDNWKKRKCNVLDGTPYVTFTAEQAQTFKMTVKISGLQYSVNFGDWKDVVAGDPGVEFGGDKGCLRLRGNNVNGTASSSLYNHSTITFTKSNVKVACTGDIRTLLDLEKYKTVDTKDARFYYLFKNCTALTSAPELPAETLAGSCYSYMFSGCTSLKVAPKLPATELAKKCYQGMFYECKSLQTAPTLPAETLATDCYYEMFYGCSSLKVAPKLPAKKMESQCYSGMFVNCSSLKVAPELPATELAERCYLAMFISCENLTTAPELPATTLQKNCYDQMFNYCTKLSSITIMAPSTEISEKSFYNNFNWIKKAGTDKSVTSRTLKVEDKAAYNALVDKGLEENWQIGQCKVLDKGNNEIQK